MVCKSLQILGIYTDASRRRKKIPENISLYDMGE
jgi:hypothetical protein